MNTESNDELNAKLDCLRYFNSQAGSQVASIFPTDYCNDWSAVMPLAVEHKLIINLNLGTAAGVDSKGFTHLCSDYNKPQRAIVCCLITIMEQNK
jgi:hypothetical protein